MNKSKHIKLFAIITTVIILIITQVGCSSKTSDIPQGKLSVYFHELLGQVETIESIPVNKIVSEIGKYDMYDETILPAYTWIEFGTVTIQLNGKSYQYDNIPMALLTISYQNSKIEVIYFAEIIYGTSTSSGLGDTITHRYYQWTRQSGMIMDGAIA